MKQRQRSVVAVLTVLLAVALAGCAVDPSSQAMNDPQQRQLAMARMYHDYFDDAAANAIVRQTTVFPHYFEPRSARLNDLGRQELGMLAGHLREYPGHVRMTRTAVPQDLYDARATSVLAFLREREVDVSRVMIVDAAPDGDGMASERVAAALARENEQRGKAGKDDLGILMLKQGGTNASTNLK